MQLASCRCVRELDYSAALQADVLKSSSAVVVAMETVNNPAAYTGTPASMCAPVKAKH